MESDDDIGHLHARVVDIVLNFDRLPADAQHANEGVAQHGITQVPDVGGLIRIDIRVLDDDLFAARSARDRIPAAKQALTISATIEPNVQVAIARNFKRSTPGIPREVARNSAAICFGARFNCFAS